MSKTGSRDKLTEVATQLFAERGLYGVGIRELSRAAGVSISMISYHFGGKEGLYAAILQEQFACFREIEEMREARKQPLELIEEYVRWTIRRHRNSPHLLRFYTSELTNPTPYSRTIVFPAIERVIRVLIESVEEGVARGEFRKDLHPANAVLALAGMVNYFFLSTLATENLISHSAEKDEQLIRQYLEIFTRGIVA